MENLNFQHNYYDNHDNLSEIIIISRISAQETFIINI